MAIQVPNTLSELQIMAMSRGLTITPSGKNGKFMKEDYIVPLRERILMERYGFNVPEYYDLLANIKSPMLSKRIDELNKDLQDEIWNNSNWDLEEKINGVRCIVVKCGEEIHIFSRENSKSDLLPIEIMGIPLDIDKSVLSNIRDFILDCELVVLNPDICMYLESKGILSDSVSQALELVLINMNPKMALMLQEGIDFKYKFYAIDCLYYDSQWVMSNTLSERRETLDKVLNSIKGTGIRVSSPNHSNAGKKSFYNMCIASGYEGVIAKRLDSVYVPDTKRNSKGWIKVKKVEIRKQKKFDMNDFSSQLPNAVVQDNAEQGVSLGDTVDGFISGFIPGERGTLSEGVVQSIEVSVFVLEGEEYKQKSLGYISNIEASLRDQMSMVVGGYPTLNPICYNAVVELDAICNTVLGFRYDKSAQECIMENTTYSQVMNFKESLC